MPWGGVVVDEAHRLKNSRGKLLECLRAVVARGARAGAQRRLLLTGTPLQNDTQELWALMNFVAPHHALWGDRAAFGAAFGALETADQARVRVETDHRFRPDWHTLKLVSLAQNEVFAARASRPRARLRFRDPRGRSGSGPFTFEHILNISVSTQVHALQAALAPHLLRRVKEDVAKDIPLKTETVVDVELTLTQKRYYRALYEHERRRPLSTVGDVGTRAPVAGGTSAR